MVMSYGSERVNAAPPKTTLRVRMVNRVTLFGNLFFTPV